MKKWVTFLATLVMMRAGEHFLCKGQCEEADRNASPGRRFSCAQNGCG